MHWFYLIFGTIGAGIAANGPLQAAGFGLMICSILIAIENKE